jgi:hypothetical protein
LDFGEKWGRRKFLPTVGNGIVRFSSQTARCRKNLA